MTARGIDCAAVEYSPVGYGHTGAVADYTEFVQALHAVDARVFALNVLVYRAHAFGPGGLLQHARGELETAPAIIGVNACDIGIPSATFWEEGRAYMELQWLLFALSTPARANLRGFAVHDYGCYSTLRR